MYEFLFADSGPNLIFVTGLHPLGLAEWSVFCAVYGKHIFGN